jgi:hypothetical protein
MSLLDAAFLFFVASIVLAIAVFASIGFAVCCRAWRVVSDERRQREPPSLN